MTVRDVSLQIAFTRSRAQKRELLWPDWAEEELLEDVRHRQVLFTIPKPDGPPGASE